MFLFGKKKYDKLANENFAHKSKEVAAEVENLQRGLTEQKLCKGEGK